MEVSLACLCSIIVSWRGFQFKTIRQPFAVEAKLATPPLLRPLPPTIAVITTAMATVPPVISTQSPKKF